MDWDDMVFHYICSVARLRGAPEELDRFATVLYNSLPPVTTEDIENY